MSCKSTHSSNAKSFSQVFMLIQCNHKQNYILLVEFWKHELFWCYLTQKKCWFSVFILAYLIMSNLTFGLFSLFKPYFINRSKHSSNTVPKIWITWNLKTELTEAWDRDSSLFGSIQLNLLYGQIRSYTVFCKKYTKNKIKSKTQFKAAVVGNNFQQHNLFMLNA